MTMNSTDFATGKSREENFSPSSSHVNHLERLHTAGGHVDDRTQPSLPVYHRTFASPSPLGLISFATGKSLIPFIYKLLTI